jgi:hypothetical protein
MQYGNILRGMFFNFPADYFYNHVEEIETITLEDMKKAVKIFLI